MTKVTWDKVGEKVYETGVDHGVLYIPNEAGDYANGFGWNGLTTVTESPSGAEASPQYADNIKYLNLVSAEEFGGTIEAFTYPDEFEQCDGTAELSPGVTIGQQDRKTFGFSWRTLKGNDTLGTSFGYKIHVIYGALAAPSERANATVNDSPEAVALSWEVTTTPVAVEGHKPTAHLTIDSTKVDADALAAFEAILYGSEGAEPRLPLPDEIAALFENTIVAVATVAPTYVQGTHIITIPATTGVLYKIKGVTKAAGAQPAITETTVVTAVPASGYTFTPTSDNDWTFVF